MSDPFASGETAGDPALNDPVPTDPVTVSVARKVLPGQESAYEAWLKRVTATASHFPGHLGANVLRPSAATGGEYVLIYRFDTYAHARDWELSAERDALVAEVAPLVEGEAVRKRVTGLEFWFDLPSVPVTAKPPPHKMALVLVVVVFTLVYGLNRLLEPLIGGLPDWLRLLVVIIIQVLLMTYLVMPRVTRLLKGWLYRAA
ncbi:antibiotic biosynthesis monooxygenase [Thiohalocapsa marina]|uniref:Antibiotic biosynthesis monooxygenase n=1 Tax=Thiohalocapsa marina TaxID=424902 RepID=A0A5M8FES1_9GAMM|nr:antibiotic biosynthesis monooxygenase [Thiohalocapsa marina]KAA6183177.1 antibiotic biosynthesis monooxygenase [Thiohalocapsa marina]